MQTFTKTRSTETFCIDSRGFLHLKFRSENNYILLRFEELNHYIDAISKICNSNVSSILVDIRDITGLVSIDFPCYRLLAKDTRLKAVCTKLAFVSNSHHLSLKIENYIAMHKPKVRTRVFNDLEDGINYCTNPQI